MLQTMLPENQIFVHRCTILTFRKQGFNLLRPKEASVVHPLTTVCSSLPAAGFLNNLFPEGKRATLCGTHRIDFAPIIVKHAVTVRQFDQTEAIADFSHVLSHEIAIAHSEKFCDAINVFDADPHIARGASATIAAASAFEFQTVFVPHDKIINRQGATGASAKAPNLYQSIE